MRNSWKEVMLKSLCRERRMLYEPSLKEYLPYIGLEHITQGTLQLTEIGKSNDTISTKKKFLKGDILFGSLRPYFRKVVSPNFSGVCSTDITVLYPLDEKDRAFLFYLIASQPFIDYATVTSNGTKMPRAKWKNLAKTKWFVPNIEERQQIGNILSAYDELIDNNNRRIALLEQMAEQIYKEWFVRFRFPGYENAKFVKGIPEGWEIRSLEDVCSLIKRGISPSYSEEGASIAINQRCIRDHRIDLSIGRKQKKKVPSEKIVQDGDILINSTGVGTLGRTAQYFGSDKNLTADSHVTIVRPSEVNHNYLGDTIMNLEQWFEQLAVGSTGQTELNREVICKTQILVPPNSLQTKYSDVVNPLRAQVRVLTEQNAVLRNTRDLLLPRLISGQLSVKAVEREKEFARQSQQVKAGQQMTLAMD